MENWWEAAPVAADKEAGGENNWWDEAPVVQERADTSTMGRIGKAFDLGEAAAIKGGQEMTRDQAAALETSALGRGLDAARDFVDENLLSNEDGSPNMLGRLANWARGSGEASDGIPRQMVGGPDVTPEQRREAILNKDLGAAYDGARGVLATLAAEGFTPKSYEEVNGVGSFAQFVAENLAASAPQMGASIAAGPLGPGLNVILLGAEANDELKSRTDLTLDQRVALATGAGTFMAALEQFGLAKMLGPLSPGKVAVDALDGKLVDVLTKKGVPLAVSRTIETAIVEGTTESLQEATVMGVTALSGGEYTAEEVVDRLAQSFTAGAAVGGTIGSVTNTLSRPEKDSGVSTGETAPDQKAALDTTAAAPTAPVAPAPAVPDEVAVALGATRSVLGTPKSAPAPAAATAAAPAPVATDTAVQAETPAKPVAQEETPAPAATEPPVPDGMVRVYHSGSVGEGETGRWVSSNRQYASDYRQDLPLFYLDLPANDPRVNNPDYADQGVRQGFTFNFELTPEEAARLTKIDREGGTTPEPAPEAVSGPEAAGDTLPTVPEAPATIENQNAALLDPKNKRKAVFIPNSSYEAGEVQEPEGRTIKRVVLPEGILFYNTAKGYTANDIRALYKSGRLGTVLGLGEFTKADVAASAAQGNPPVAVTERTPDGVEVKAAAGTVETAPEQMAALEAEAAPENTVQVEAPQNVIAQRLAARQPANPVRQVEITPEVRARYERPGTEAAARGEDIPGFQSWMAGAFDKLQRGEIPEGTNKSLIKPVESLETFVAAESMDDQLNAAVMASEGEVRKVRISDLRTTQPFVETSDSTSSAPPAVADIGGVLVVMDGNHRVNQAIRSGQSEIDVRVTAVGDGAATAAPAPTATNPAAAERAKEVSRARSTIEETSDGRRIIRVEPTAEEQALINEATDRAAAARSAPSDILRQNVDRSAQIESANKGEPETVEAELAARRGFAEDKNAKREAAAVENAVKTQKLFEDMAPKEIENIRSIRDAALVYQRLEATLKEAKKRGITVIKRVLPSHTNAQAWLSSVDKMASKLARMSKNPTEKTRMAVMGDLATFLSNEFIFVDTGDATDLRASRAEEGTAAMARGPSKGGADITESAADENAETGEEALIANEDATEEEIESVPDEVTDDADMEDDEPDVPEVPDVPQPTIRESDPEPVDATPSGVQFDEEGKPVFQARTAAVETKKKRVLVGRQLPDGERKRIEGKLGAAIKKRFGRGMGKKLPSFEDSILEALTLGEVAQGISEAAFQDSLITKNTILSPKEARLQKLLSKELFKAINGVVADVPVYIVSDAFFDTIAPSYTMGMYLLEQDMIVVRQSATTNPNAALHIMLHEGSHAAFEAAIYANKALETQLTELLNRTQAHALAVGYTGSRYGFENIHEFLSEAWSNPQFQEFLSTVPLSAADAKALGIKGTMVGQIRSAMSWLKFTITNFLGVKKAFAQAGYPADTKTTMEAMIDIGGRLLEISPQARALYAGTSAGNPTVRPSIELDPSPDSIEGKLRSRGLSPVQAKNVAEVIANEFGGKATDADLDAIAQKIALAMTGQTPSAGGNTGSPKIDKATKESDAPEGKDATGWRAFLLKLRTLDDIVRTYGDRFKDKQGNALLDYLNAVFSYEPVRRQVEDRHNIDFAEFEDFRKANPEEAKKLSDLITEIAPFDVNLGPNADNSHLDGNAKANLQAKARLPELQAQYDALSPEAKALMEKMSENYRQSHNDAVRGVVYNTLALLDKKLSNSEVMRLMEAAVEGKLTDADKDTIDNDTVFQTLVNARELRLRKGLYFPSVRFGDFVVTTETTIDDPGITKVTLKTGRKSKANPGKALPTVPVTSEVTGGTVRFFVDPDVRGARTALDRTVSDWVSKQDLPLASYRIKYRDRTTGELVTKSNQRPDRDYDYVIEVNFQNKGVHFFETESEAKTFARDAAQDVVNGVLTNASVVMSRHNTQDLGNVIKGSVAEALMRSFDARNTDDDGTKTRRAQAQALLQEIIAQQLPGNRYEKRLLKRKNVAGYSQEIGRAAAHYGRQVGNYIAAVQTGPARHEAFDRILEIERERGAKDGVLSQVVNELRSREQEVGQNHHTSQLADNLVMINGWDKLASAANWMINGTQVVTNSLAVLGGRHGNGASVKALTAAYSKIGTASTLARGVRNTATAVTQVGNNELDTEDLVANIRKNLGQKYHDLVDAMTETGDVATDVGIESATTLSSGAGKFTKGVAKVDRIVRQMPNTMEAINRMVTAVAAYDLARKDGMSHKDAIAYAQDVTRQTQGRYDLANSPVWMQRAGVLRFALVFKKYAQLQYQLLGDILRRAFSGATPEEKAVAAKQFGNLMGINLAIGGLLGLPGIEAAKLVALAGMAFGGEEWDEWQERWREIVRGVVGEDIEQAINKGALSKVLDVDLQSRMGWQDLVTGFAPKALDPEGLTSFIGTTILGAPGGMAVDMLRAREAWQDGEVLKALGFLIPIKQVVDATKTVRGVSEGEMTAGDAIRQVIGFRSLRQAEIGDRLGSEIRDSKERRSDRERLEKAWMNADTPAEVAKAAAAIRRYNEALPEGQRKISIDALRRYKANDRARFN